MSTQTTCNSCVESAEPSAPATTRCVDCPLDTGRTVGYTNLFGDRYVAHLLGPDVTIHRHAGTAAATKACPFCGGA